MSVRGSVSLFHTSNLDSESADKNQHWKIWPLPISVNWIFNGQEKYSRQKEKYVYRLLTHTSREVLWGRFAMFTLVSQCVCNGNWDLSPKCHVVGALGSNSPLAHHSLLWSDITHPSQTTSCLSFSRSEEKWWSFGELCMQWPTQKRQAGSPYSGDNWVTLSLSLGS